MRIVPTSSFAAPVAPSPTAADVQIMERMRADETLERIKVLEKEPRVWGSPAHAKAVDYVVEAMKAAGWDVRVEELKGSSWSGNGLLRNVVAERKGTAPDGERGLVVAGAHLDSVRRAPGANDNASGSATLIELAEAYTDMPTRNDLRFVWFDGEEAGLLGSRAHVKANAADNDRTIAMINMDMVGSPHGAVGFDLGRRTSNAVADVARGVALRTGQTFVEHPRHNRSDHASFDAAGIPALDFGVGVNTVEQEDPNYHSPSDKSSAINPKVLEGFGDFIGTTLYEFANRSSRAFSPYG